VSLLVLLPARLIRNSQEQWVDDRLLAGVTDGITEKLPRNQYVAGSSPAQGKSGSRFEMAALTPCSLMVSRQPPSATLRADSMLARHEFCVGGPSGL